MPTVAVHDLLVHPRENDLVVGTYGRGIFITDITPLQEMNEKVLAEKIYFFKVEPKVQWMAHTYGGNYNLYGHRHLSTPNEPEGIVIDYYLKDEVKEKVKITISDSDGKIISRLEGKTNAGINSVIWNMRRQTTKQENAQMRRRGRGTLVNPGEYVVILEVGDKKLTQKALIKKRAGWTVGPKTSKSMDPHK